MTFGSTFGRVFSPTFKPHSQAPAVSSSWWLSGGISAANCVAAYQAKGAADYAASKVNLNNPGTDDAIGGGSNPTWDATNGWVFTTTTVAISTPIHLLNGYSLIVRYSNVTNNGALGGAYNYSGSTGGILLFPNSSSKVVYYCPNAVSVSPALTAGVLAVAGNDCYRDGTDEGTGTGSIPDQTNHLYFGANYNGSAVTNQLAGYIQAAAVYSTTISSSQVAALVTAMNAL